ncbi:MAG: hypothetical protein AAF614_06975, partial [Chloroflexota bacterium]
IGAMFRIIHLDQRWRALEFLQIRKVSVGIAEIRMNEEPRPAQEEVGLLADRRDVFMLRDRSMLEKCSLKSTIIFSAGSKRSYAICV